MKDWLKFFGLSFFSDKIVKTAHERGVMNCVLGFVLTLVFIFCGVLAANTVPFYTHYANAAGYRSFLYDLPSGLNIDLGGGLAYADKQVNTLLSSADAQLYGKNGYDLVVDTRPADTLDDFVAYCVAKDGQKEISYEHYLELPDEDKAEYDFKVRYTPDELVLTDELAQKHELFLSESADTETANSYARLAQQKDELSAREYRLKLYALYVKAYYPDMSAFERVGEVPLLRSYYYRNHLNSNDIKKCMFVFSDVLIGFFDTDNGLSVTFYGSYADVRDGTLTAQNVDAFIKDVFASSVSASSNIYLMNTCKYIPIIAAIPLILAFLLKLFFVLRRDDRNKKLSFCIKVECAYLTVASLLTAIVLFVCGFFVSSGTLNVLPLIVFAAVMTVRTVAFMSAEVIRAKRAKAVAQ